MNGKSAPKGAHPAATTDDKHKTTVPARNGAGTARPADVEPLDRVLDHLEGAKRVGAGWMARCPAHDDCTPSLSVTEARDGRVLLHCHAGCETTAIAAALGLTMADLFADDVKRTDNAGPRKLRPDDPAPSGRIVAAYPYIDARGTALYEVVRLAPKSFRQRRHDGRGGWLWNIEGIPRVPYMLPALVAAVHDGRRVYVAEGEKDVETLVGFGFCATCNPGGAGKWRPEFDRYFDGADVVVVPDADEPGRKHAEDVARHLRGVARSVRVLELPGLESKQDVTDWADAQAGDDAARAALEELADGAPLWEPGDDDAGEEPNSWQPVDLGPILDGTTDPPEPTLGRFTGSERGIFYSGAINGVHGDSGSGKTWLVLVAVAQELNEGHACLVLDWEANPAETVGRLVALGVQRDTIAEHLVYVRPNDPADTAAVDSVVALCRKRGVTIAVLDSLGEAFGIQGVDEDRDAEVGPWIRAVARQIADAGPAVVLVDHSTKAKDNVLYPSGSKRKRAAITGASFLVEAPTPPTRERPGTLRVTCAKDRHGTYARGACVADVPITPWPDGTVTIEMHRARPKAEAGPDLAQDFLTRKLLRILRDAGRPMTRNEILGADGVKAGDTRKRGALDRLEALGCVHVEPGPNRSNMTSYVHELPDDEASDTTEDRVRPGTAGYGPDTPQNRERGYGGASRPKGTHQPDPPDSLESTLDVHTPRAAPEPSTAGEAPRESDPEPRRSDFRDGAAFAAARARWVEAQRVTAPPDTAAARVAEVATPEGSLFAPPVSTRGTDPDRFTFTMGRASLRADAEDDPSTPGARADPWSWPR